MSIVADWLRISIGRPLGWAEALLRRPPSAAPSPEEGDLDKTGRVVASARRLEVLWREGSLLYADCGSPAHSLWRAQELSLFNGFRDRLPGPVLDVGCGDGSFASVVFEHLDYGLDKDPAALETAAQYGLYGKLLQGTDQSIPLHDGVAGSAMANSVFEHVVELAPLLKELRRVLKPGGLLVFTVPVRGFARHLSRYFGDAVSRSLNADYYHRNLWEPEEWAARLKACGFEPVEMRRYQPASFSFVYFVLRYLGRRKGLGRWIPGADRLPWALFSRRLTGLVRASLAGEAEDGANLFVVARKT